MKKKINLAAVLVGTDFELFIKDSEGKFISAIPLIEGTKHEPQAVSDKGHFIQHDGVLAEFNCPPVDLQSGDEMWNNIQFVMEEGASRLPPKMKLVCCTNGEFAEDQLQDDEAKIAGCSPSFDAWNDGNIAPKPDFGVTNDRCAGFHWHFTWPGCDLPSGMRLIRLLDVYVTLSLLFVDEDRKRRLLYGRMGDFRYRGYGGVSGIEFRVLSNVVIKNPEVFKFVWDQINTAFRAFNKGEDYLQYKDRLEEAINNYNLDQAEQLCDELGIKRLIDEEVTVL